jgi:hypothetical protein
MKKGSSHGKKKMDEYKEKMPTWTLIYMNAFDVIKYLGKKSPKKTHLFFCNTDEWSIKTGHEYINVYNQMKY